MTFRASAASNPALKNVQYVEFYIKGTDTTLVVNKSQMVGRYTTLANAREALEGILIKNGANLLASSRLTDLNKNLIYLDSTFVLTPSPLPNWIDHTLTIEDELLNYAGAQQRLQSCTAPVLLTFTSSNPLVDLYAKQSVASVPTNTSISPDQDGYTKVNGTIPFLIDIGFFVRLKGKYLGGLTGTPGTTVLATSTITVTNKTTNTLLDTFVITVSEFNTP